MVLSRILGGKHSQRHQENRNAKPEIEHSKRNRMKAFLKSYQGKQNRHSSTAAVASKQETAVIRQSTIQYAKEKEGRERSSTDSGENIQIRDAGTGELLWCIELEDRYCMLAISPNGRFAACASYLGDVTRCSVWDANQGTLLHSHESMKYLHLLLSSFEVWDATRDQLHIYKSVEHGTWAAVFSPDGDSIATFTVNGQVCIRDWANGEFKSIMWYLDDNLFDNPSSYFSWISFPSNGPMVSSLTGNGDKRIWESIPTVLTRMLYCRGFSPTGLTFSPDGKIIAVSQSYDDQIELWDGTLQCAGLTHEAHQRSIRCLLFSPDGTAVTTTAMDDTVRVWDAASGAMTWLIAEKAPVYLAFSADGRVMVSANPKTGFTVWNAVGRKLLRSISFPGTDTRKQDSGYTKLALSLDGSLLAFGNYNIKLWDALHGAHMHTLEGWNIPIRCLVISPDGSRIAATGRNFKAWSTSNGELAQSFNNSSQEPILAFSSDGKIVASARKTITLWDIATGDCLGKLLLTAR